MNPQNDQQNAPVGVPLKDQPYRRAIQPAPRQHSSGQRAAADLIRGQLNSIYGGGSDQSTPHTTPVSHPKPLQDQSKITQQSTTQNADAVSNISGHGLRTAPSDNSAPHKAQLTKDEEAAASPYQRTMDTSVSTKQPSEEQWKQYHSAWQKYYQMYYERQYLASSYTPAQSTGVSTTTEPNSSEKSSENSVSQQEAMKELRESIRQKVTQSATKVKKSRHFIPVIAGVSVLLVFTFLQYNRVLFGAVSAYVSPGNIDPQNIIVDPTVNVEVGPEPRMIIPKINIDAPVVYGVGPDDKSQMAAMENGIAHFSIPGANAVPGQIGNSVFAAHSSNDVFAPGDYKFVFAQNEKLDLGDVIYMNFEGKRYTYSITSTEVVLPKEVSKIQIDTDKPMLTLISCVPLGTAEKRLLIFAEQVSPDPVQAESSNTSSAVPDASKIPGRPNPTLLEKIFGAS